jgi:hypothetical protein
VAVAVLVFPATSVAVHVTVKVPTALVTTGSHLCEATPDVGSEAFALAVAVPLRTTGFGVTVGLRTGPVVSM